MQFDHSVTIRRSPADIFAFLADVHLYATPPGSPVAAMDKIPAGPTGVGTRWREVIKLGLRMRMTVWSEVTACEPGRLLAETWSGGNMRGTLTYRIEVTPAGTGLHQSKSLEAVGWLRPFQRMIDRILPPKELARLEEIARLLDAGEDRGITAPAAETAPAAGS
jgi:hypothetical protein